MADIILKLKKSGLTGRGGAAFPTWKKWSSVAKAMEGKQKDEKKCYVICNASEGEPGVKKDYYILENYASEVIDGINKALDFFMAERAFFYLNSDYYKKFSAKLLKLIGNIELK